MTTISKENICREYSIKRAHVQRLSSDGAILRVRHGYSLASVRAYLGEPGALLPGSRVDKLLSYHRAGSAREAAMRGDLESVFIGKQCFIFARAVEAELERRRRAETHKTCAKCGEEKELSEFPTRTEGGVKHACRECDARQKAVSRQTKAARDCRVYIPQGATLEDVEQALKSSGQPALWSQLVERAQDGVEESLRARFRQEARAEFQHLGLYSGMSEEDKRQLRNERLALVHIARYRSKHGDEAAAIYTCEVVMRRMVRRLLTSKQGARTAAILGYTAEELREHMERQFKPGMTWENYGDWHIDHIVPLVPLLKDGVRDPAAVCCLANLQPLWASENYAKRDKLEWEEGTCAAE